MTIDRIALIEAFSIRLPRDAAAVTGTAGTPAELAAGGFDYRWSKTSSTLYSVNFEAALVKVTLESGLAGWGEAQAPLAPDIACLIIDQLLRPAVEGQDFDGSPERVRSLRNRMYSTMRVRGQTGGFMLDAIAGVDIALWDLAGKARGTSVADLLSSSVPKNRIPCYLSGLPGATNADRVERAREAWNAGFRIFKLFYDRTEEELFDLIDRLRAALGPEASIAVDALWRLDGASAVGFGRRLDDRGALWLECPLAPESPADHADLAAEIRTPIALGETYRTRYELAPFLACGCARVVAAGHRPLGDHRSSRPGAGRRRQGSNRPPYQHCHGTPDCRGPAIRCFVARYRSRRVQPARLFGSQPLSQSAPRGRRRRVPRARRSGSGCRTRRVCNSGRSPAE